MKVTVIATGFEAAEQTHAAEITASSRISNMPPAAAPASQRPAYTGSLNLRPMSEPAPAPATVPTRRPAHAHDARVPSSVNLTAPRIPVSSRPPAPESFAVGAESDWDIPAFQRRQR